jgi:hypothetical protein
MQTCRARNALLFVPKLLLPSARAAFYSVYSGSLEYLQRFSRGPGPFYLGLRRVGTRSVLWHFSGQPAFQKRQQ